MLNRSFFRCVRAAYAPSAATLRTAGVAPAIAAPAPLGARAVHSKRVLRRFRGHPRTWLPAQPEAPLEASTLPLRVVEPLPSGWSPPLGAQPGVPFSVRFFFYPAALLLSSARTPTPPPSLIAPSPRLQVQRTAKSNMIPVYSDYKNGRTRELTVVRRVTGDVGALAAELVKVTGGAKVEVRPGRVEVAGNRVPEVRAWLAGLGF
jgi:hypothetical protein